MWAWMRISGEASQNSKVHRHYSQKGEDLQAGRSRREGKVRMKDGAKVTKSGKCLKWNRVRSGIWHERVGRPVFRGAPLIHKKHFRL